jgi:broad specificity phosphatase PhoE
MTALLIRHGETEWNVVRRYQGQLDPPLTERGLAQAEAVARRLAELCEFDSAPVVASPLGRARRTAEIICARRRSTASDTDERLREITLGRGTAFSATRLPHAHQAYSRRHGAYEWYFHSAAGECYEKFEARLASFLRSQNRHSSLSRMAW